MTYARIAGIAVLALLAAPVAAQRPSPAVPPGAEAVSLLGKPLVPAPLPDAVRRRYEERLAEAKRAYDRTPADADSIIWLGRRTAYLGRYRDAIAIFTRGIELHPNDARLYRHRGHRYITVRQLGHAVADLRRAYDLTRGQPDAPEPDGLPNARGIPTSTLKSNIRYHLALAHYLEGDFERALPLYQEDVAAQVNDDMLVASTHWLYMTLRRLGRDDAAAAALRPISADLEVIENGSYHRLLLLYKGELTPEGVLTSSADDDAALQDVTVSYGIGNWHYYNGRDAEARRIFDRILATAQWAAFGYVAAEAEVARWR